MNFLILFEHLSPEAQTLLLLCLLVTITGIVMVTFMAALSQRATRNICRLIFAISRLLNTYRWVQKDHEGGCRSKASYEGP